MSTKLNIVVLTLIFFLQNVVALQARNNHRNSVRNGQGPNPQQFITVDNESELILDTFESGVNGWKAGGNVEKVIQTSTSLNPPGKAYKGQYMLEYIDGAAPGTSWRTAYKTYSEGLNLENTPIVSFALNSYGAGPGNSYEARIDFFSGSEKKTKVFSINPNRWNLIAVSLLDWPFKNAIDKIAVSFRTTTFTSPWKGRHQIDHIVARSADLTFKSEWQFNKDNDPEGWKAAKSLSYAQVKGGHFSAVVSGRDPQLINSFVSIDTKIHKYLKLSLKNNTASDEGRLFWKTTEQAGFSPERSARIDLDPNSNSYRLYGLDLSDNLNWDGVISKIRLDIPNSPTVNSGSVSINTIKISPFPEEVYHAGSVNDIEATSSNILVHGTIERKSPVTLHLIELKPHESYQFDKAYEPIDTMSTEPSNGKYNFSFSAQRHDGQRDRIYSKFVVLVKDPKQKLTLGPARYVTTFPPARYSYPYPSSISKKGLQVQMVDDAQKLGASWGKLNFVVSRMFLKDNSKPSIAYQMDGKTYYFRKNYIENFDQQLKNLSDNGMNVTLVIIFIGGQIPADSPNKDIRHPDYQSGTIAAINTTNQVGMDYWKAGMEFLVERYTREDEKYGRAVDYIIGNEVDAAFQWNDMGRKELSDYINQYSRTLRLAYIAARKKYEHVKIYNSLTHNWGKAARPNPWRSYTGKGVMDQLNYVITREGNIPWNVAYHSYPEKLFDPEFWKDENTTDSFNTPYITFDNLHVITDYMKQPSFLYRGLRRDVALTEQGFHTKDRSIQSQKIQAAAYAYAYYKVKFLDGINYFILNRHVDHGLEGGLKLGIWFRDTNAQFPAKPSTPKYIYDVVDKIDTQQSLEVTDFAKSIIGIQNWDDVIPTFNPAELNDRELPTPIPVAKGGYIKPILHSDSFENSGTGWRISEYSKSLSVTTASSGKNPYEGKQALKVNFQKGDRIGGAMAENGITKTFSDPVDLRASPRFQLAVNAPGGVAGADSFSVTLRVYSGDFNIAEGVAEVTPDQWNTLSFDLGKWKYLNKVTKVKVWFSANTNTNWINSIYYDHTGWNASFLSVKKLTQQYFQANNSNGKGVLKSLLNKLDRAENASEKGDSNRKDVNMKSYVRELRAQSGNKFTTNQVQELTNLARGLMTDDSKIEELQSSSPTPGVHLSVKHFNNPELQTESYLVFEKPESLGVQSQRLSGIKSETMPYLALYTDYNATPSLSSFSFGIEESDSISAVFPLYLKTEAVDSLLTGHFKLSLLKDSNFGENQKVLLGDKLDGNTVNLTEITDYTFNIHRGSDTVAEDEEQKAKPDSDTQGYNRQGSPRFVLVITSRKKESPLPTEYSLSQNYPNPFNPETTIKFKLPEENTVTLKVYDILGREVATLVNQEQLAAGGYRYNWNASSFASGIYLYRLEMRGRVITKKMMLIK